MSVVFPPRIASSAKVSFSLRSTVAFLNFKTGSLLQRKCHVSVVDTGARAAAEACSSTFEGETEGVVNEPFLRYMWASSLDNNVAFYQPQFLHRVLNAALARTAQAGFIMGPSYWDTPEEHIRMEESRVQCAGGGGPCPALSSDWVLGAAQWSQRVRYPC